MINLVRLGKTMETNVLTSFVIGCISTIVLESSAPLFPSQASVNVAKMFVFMTFTIKLECRHIYYDMMQPTFCLIYLFIFYR